MMREKTNKRKTEWALLAEPKPSWETFTRMLNYSKGNTNEALKRWKKYISQPHVKVLENRARLDEESLKKI